MGKIADSITFSAQFYPLGETKFIHKYYKIYSISTVVLLPYQIRDDVEGGYALARSVEAHLCRSLQKRSSWTYVHTPLLQLTFVPSRCCVSSVT